MTRKFQSLARPAHRPRRAAFTLIEMVLVLAIIALLMGVSIKLLTGVQDRAKRIRAQADIEALTTALISYETDNLRLPTTEQGLAALVTKPSSAPVPRNWNRYMRQQSRDPWDEPYQYRNPGQKNRDSYDIFSMGPDRQADTEDDIGNWEDAN